MATVRQKLLAQKVIENNGNVSKSMKQAGYAKTTSTNPQQVTRSKGWAELMEQYLPDSLLAEKHNELLTVPKKVRTYIKGELIDEREEVDSQALKAGLDMAYKLKGNYAAEKKDLSGTIKIEGNKISFAEYDSEPESE